ncbi:MAG TPA: apolipoprotein N-acyltransferase, partial [Gemmatimonadales bacterium]|nr:apolipoprotein N-acyltransferase [Gemmatimonadales bacterium]
PRERGAGTGSLRWRRLAALLATVVLAWGYGAWRMKTLPVRDAGVVGLVQPNEGFREKWDPAHADSVVGTLIGLSRQLLAGSRPDLLIWPEAAIPDFLWRNPAWDAAVSRLARESSTPILTGDLYAAPGWRGLTDPYYNAALFVDSTGEWRRWPVYEKRYLVPVVERVPFVPVRVFKAVPGLARWSGGFSPGRELPVYASPIGRFGVLICYESIFEDLGRAYRRGGADFLVNITNDAWYGRTAGPYQHASHLVLRAIETRMGIARGANSGISGTVDPLGRFHDSTRLEERTAEASRLRTSDVTTLYTRLGDWVGTLAVLATLGFAGALLMLRWRSGRLA